MIVFTRRNMQKWESEQNQKDEEKLKEDQSEMQSPSQIFHAPQKVTLLELLTKYEETLKKEDKVLQSLEKSEVNENEIENNSRELDETEVECLINIEYVFEEKIEEFELSEEETEPGYGCGGIDIACDELQISNEAENYGQSHIIVKTEPHKEYEQLMMTSMIEEKLIDSPIFIQHKQQENKYCMIDDMISESSSQTSDEYPQETEDYDIKLFENRSCSIFENHLDSDYSKNEMIGKDSPLTFD